MLADESKEVCPIKRPINFRSSLMAYDRLVVKKQAALALLRIGRQTIEGIMFGPIRPRDTASSRIDSSDLHDREDATTQDGRAHE